jgi:hypothetical protein
VNLREVPRTPHDCTAVGVVADRRVALDRGELAAAEVGLDDADVVGDAAVPVVDRDVARLRCGLAEASFTPRCFSASWSAFSPLLAAVGAAGGGFVFVPVAVSSLAVFGP